MRKIIIYNLLLLIVLVASGLNGYGQNERLNKTYTWDFNVAEDVTLSFNNYDCDMTIKIWDKPVTEYKMHVTAKGSSEEDVEKLDSYLKNLKFDSSPGSVNIDMRFWRSRKMIIKKIKMKLDDGQNINLTEFKISGELIVPRNCNLNFSSKYSGIELDDISGRLNMQLYNDKLYGGKVDNSVDISAKYSTIEFSDIRKTKLDLYSSDFEANRAGNMNIESKYSKVSVNNAQDLEITSYNDKYNYDETGNINFSAKYSGFRSERSGLLKADCYNCTVNIHYLNDIEIASKYTKFEFIEGKNCHVSASYNDGIKSELLKSLNISETKYGTYKIDELTGSLHVADGYSDKFVIPKTGEDFKGIKVNGKYGKITIGVPVNLAYRLKVNIKYPNLDVNEQAFSIRIKIKEGSNLEYDAVKGTEFEGMPEFDVQGYDISLSIQDY